MSRPSQSPASRPPRVPMLIGRITRNGMVLVLVPLKR
jgi:hypothetical protein